ncbi:NlpC/P60 family protein [Streptomyces xiamenensis]|uniref:C40 family peptidase n=1 Tax=Streptomyces xiamenensis TaxID=408015 RepID=UPI0035E3411E
MKWTAWAAGVAAGFGLLLLLSLGPLPVLIDAAQREEEERQAAAVAGAGMLAPGADIPREYWALIEEWGTYCPTLTPPRLAAQLQQESSWNPDVISGRTVSVDGAMGIAQFLPGTWAEYGIDANGDGVADVLDPEDAIPSAAIYDCAVARMVRDVPGDPIDNMLAAYNAGPGNVIDHQGVPPKTWGEGETYNYVRAIRALEKTLAAPPSPYGQGPVTSQAAAVLSLAREQIGEPYVWGGGNKDGATGGGWDCSGLVVYAYYQVTGVELPRTSQTQRAAGMRVTAEQMMPGDVIVINNDGDWGHVGIYSGGGMMIHAPRPGKWVEEVELAGYWSGFPWDIRRVL